MHMATAFKCIKKLFKSNIVSAFLLDYAALCLLKYFLLFFLCEEGVKNASKIYTLSYYVMTYLLTYNSMKKYILVLLFIALGYSNQSYAQSYDGLSDARALAEQGIIVNQSSPSPGY